MDSLLQLPPLADELRISVVLPVYSETETVRQVVDWLRDTLAGQLEDCEAPSTCPHGRPTMIHLSAETLAREFGRR